MQINSISQLAALNQLQSMNDVGNTSGNDTSSLFSMLFEDMLKNAAAGNSTNAATGSISGSSKSNTVDGLDNLSLTPQTLIRMMQMNMLSNTIGTNTDSVDDDGSADSSTDDIGGISSGGTDMSELLQMMQESQNLTDSSTSNDTNLLNQTLTDNTTKPAV